MAGQDALTSQHAELGARLAAPSDHSGPQQEIGEPVIETGEGPGITGPAFTPTAETVKAYWDNGHPRHSEAVDAVHRYYKLGGRLSGPSFDGEFPKAGFGLVRTGFDGDRPEGSDDPSNELRGVDAVNDGMACPPTAADYDLSPARSALDSFNAERERLRREPVTWDGETEAIMREAAYAGGFGKAQMTSLSGIMAEVTRQVKRRADFAKTQIYLPKVMIAEGGEVRELDYETDVLSALDWRGFDPRSIAERIPENARAAENQLQRIRLSDSGTELFVGETVAANTELLAFDPTYAVRMISDIVPNPFVGREIVGALTAHLKARGFADNKLGALASLIGEELRKGLDAERSARAEAMFKAEVTAGRIQFRLRIDGRNWHMPFTVETTEPENGRKLVNKTGGPLERSLFAPIYENDLNTDERDVAVHLDGENALIWWHRNVARQQYGIQGWRKAKIYPDFIFAVRHEGKAAKITVLETKGDQFDNNLDTTYKRDVLSFLSDKFRWDDYTAAGELELVKNSGETVHCTLILMSEWQTKLPVHL